MPDDQDPTRDVTLAYLRGPRRERTCVFVSVERLIEDFIAAVDAARKEQA
jgi:hypothetical protein